MLLEQIKQKQARIGIIGLGYVGLPLVIEFGRAGFQVVGLDIDPAKTDRAEPWGKLYQAYPLENHSGTGRTEAI